MGVKQSVLPPHDPTQCTMVPEREEFDRVKGKLVYESALITFKGVDGFDVYNCSVPFKVNGVYHLFGRVERRDEWVNSYVRLFKMTGKDEFTLVTDAFVYQLEDPYIAGIHGEMLFGGIRVGKNKGKVIMYGCDFYRGQLNDLLYFTSGPARMKDIRLVQLANGKIGIFSHHKTRTMCLTGFAVIDSLSELCDAVIDSAVPIDHTLFGDAWGGVNQAYLLTTGKIGCISHHGYVKKDENDKFLNVYCITSFVYEPTTNKVYSYKILGTKDCFPPCEPKVPRLVDCVFVSGIVMRDDGKVDLYSGVGDTGEGRIVVDYPFEGHGSIVDTLSFKA